MFESITDSMNRVFRSIAGKARISEENIAEATREVRVALLEADVNMHVARGFVQRVREQALGAEVLTSVDPGEQFVKIVHDELVRLLGGEREAIHWQLGRPTALMLCGLQGSGKTSTVGKLARRFLEEGKTPLLVAADVQRPAAVQQLRVLGEQVGAPVYFQEGGDPVSICTQALEVAKLQKAGAVLFDTAGRLHVDEALMVELQNIVRATQPAEILFVCDAMIGQSAVDTAQSFAERLPLSGAIMTKMDGDARGGAALSLREVTGVPIKYVTVGEKLDALEAFHPDRMAGRILGMGDVVSLVEKAQSVVDEKEALAMQQKLQENVFTLEDFKKQMGQVRKMGGLQDLLGMIPGLGRQLQGVDLDEKEFKRVEAMIDSMTPRERREPELIDTSRRKRIALGAGASPKDVTDLLKQFREMKKMVGQMGKAGLFGGGGAGGMQALQEMMAGGMGPGGGLPGAKKKGTKAQKSKKDRKRKRKNKKRRK